MSTFVEFAAVPYEGILCADAVSCAERVALAGAGRAVAAENRPDGGLRRIGEILPLVLERYDIDENDMSGAVQDSAPGLEGLLGSGI